MDFGQQLKKIRKSKGLTQDDLSKYVGVGKTTISAYENGERSPDISKIKKIAEALQVSADYLLGTDEIIENKLSSDALEVAQDYDTLDKHGKEAVRSILKVELKRMDETDNIISPDFPEPEYIQLPYFDFPASAGTGEYLSDGWEPIIVNVRADDVPDRADFIQYVGGDSMEPEFSNGDRVYVAAQPAVEIGEIGVFSVGGETYIKKLGRGKLISLNPDYDDITITEDTPVTTRGKVLGKVSNPDNINWV